MPKINWFGRTYYGNNLEYKRPVWVAFKCFVEWDIYHKMIGLYLKADGKGGWITKYWWSKK